jgi:hypothetical protein
MNLARGRSGNYTCLALRQKRQQAGGGGKQASMPHRAGRSHEFIELTSVSLKHLFRQPPEDEEGRNGGQQGANEQESAFYFFGLSMSLDFRKPGISSAQSRLFDQTGFLREMRCSECGALLKQAAGQLPRFLYRVDILLALAFGEYRVIDRTADAKWKLQLTVYQ